MNIVNRCLYFSIYAALFFLITVIWYIVGPIYLGIWPIGIIAGTVFIIQLILSVVSIRNLFLFGLHWKLIITIAVNVSSLIGVGYFWIIWSMVI